MSKEKFKHTEKRPRVKDDDDEDENKIKEMVQKDNQSLRSRAEKLEKQEELKIKREGRKPWKPARSLEIPAGMKDSRFVYRFVERLRPGNLRKKLDEGWEIDTKIGKKLNELYGGLEKTLDDGSPMDSTVQMRELIVLRMPKVIHEERSRYYFEQSNIDAGRMKGDMERNISKTAQEMRGSGQIPDNEKVYSGGVYGSYSEEQKSGG